MAIKQKIGDRIKSIRTERQISQEHLANISQVDRTFVNHVENGRRNISVDSLEKILIGLEISFRDFFDDNLFANTEKGGK